MGLDDLRGIYFGKNPCKNPPKSNSVYVHNRWICLTILSHCNQQFWMSKNPLKPNKIKLEPLLWFGSHTTHEWYVPKYLPSFLYIFKSMRMKSLFSVNVTKAKQKKNKSNRSICNYYTKWNWTRKKNCQKKKSNNSYLDRFNIFFYHKNIKSYIHILASI